MGHVKSAWFKNAVFRRAVSSAIDRDAMIRSIYYGHGVKSWSLSTPGDKVWATPDVPHDDYDVERARRLLSTLGMTDRNGDGHVGGCGRTSCYLFPKGAREQYGACGRCELHPRRPQ